jgi:gamma-glutamyltranspeptidase/glutathione hydrolase
MSRDFHLPGRSPVYAREGMAATSHPLASLAAIETLRAGGSAADAAVTAVALLSVIEPAMTGIGGDCFCLVAKPGTPVWGYNGSGRTGAAMNLDALLAQGLTGSVPQDSIHAITVPGALDAWEAILKVHGRFGLDRILAPAIRMAQDGYAIPPRMAFDWSLAAERLRKDKGATLHYLPGGEPPAVGDVIKLPALAATLNRIAAGGSRAFYETDIAQDIVDTVAPRGNTLAASDFAAHRGEEVVPISSNYRGLDIVELPPNGQGLAALILLNILERFDMAALDPAGAERAHIALEAARLAYAVRDTHIADPAFMRMAVPRLLDREFAADLADKIDRTQRSDLPQAPGPRGDTTLVTVVDRDRTAVSIINSLFVGFGSAIATEKTGILLHNRGMSFVLDPKNPNCAGPRKRPMHTIIPALAMREGRCELAFGVMGGSYQAMGHAHFVSNLVDYEMDVQAAIDAPRYFFDGPKTMIERGLSSEAVEGLKRRGHDVMVRPVPFGGAQAVQIDWERGILIGGSDARKDGCALGY